ncbi:serine hydrolase domain-containing protein [Streptomyces antioxidans]|uniref:serine hydrolase domain-containing protein n=1 Tax=Streptomyces antioxidans TaxID=1507734 RepID=UPI0006147604|nr:serine hydrolase domain-containing protein [Streptomyces antioxidans]
MQERIVEDAIGGVTAVSALEPTAELQRGLDGLHEAGGTGVIAVLETPDGVVTARAGVGDKETGEPVPYDTRCRVGFVQMSFMAVVTLQLVAEGKLSLEDTVERWLPGLVTGNGHDGAKVSVRHLLQHTSGVYDYTHDMETISSLNYVEGYAEKGLRTYTPHELIDVAMGAEPKFAPGTDWGFSYTNYTLIGMIIEAVTGNDWREELNTRIVGQLGLRDTVLPGADPEMPEPHARSYCGYNLAEPIDVTRFNPTVVGAAGEMISTPADLIRFFTALHEGTLLPEEQRRQMYDAMPAPQLAAMWPGACYGLGLIRLPLAEEKGYFYGHGGGFVGWNMRGGISEDGRRRMYLGVTGEITVELNSKMNDLVARHLSATD